MVVAGRLEPADDRLAEAGQQVDQAIVLGPGVEHRQAPAAGMAWDLDQHLVAGLGDIDRYENAPGSGVGWGLVMVGSSPK